MIFFARLMRSLRFGISLLLVFLSCSILVAAELPLADTVRKERTVEYVPAPSKEKSAGGFLQGMESYKPIYVVSTWFLGGEGSDKDYMDQELLMAFSFKREIYWNLYFAYSHKAFWQIYDHQKSRPFREHNYNPELFLVWNDLLTFDRVRLGLIEHESNGEQLRYDKNGKPINYSRTWNRSYVYARKSVHSLVHLGLKLWIVTDSEDPEDGSFIVDNSDIEQYMGTGEFYAELGRFPSVISIMFRQGWREETETIQVDGRLPLHILTGWEDDGIDFFVQWFSGYGDSLIDYNRRVTRFSAGVAFR